MYCIQRRSNGGRGRETEWKGETKRKRHLIMYAFSCKTEQKRMCEGKKRERPRERVRETECTEETFL